MVEPESAANDLAIVQPGEQDFQPSPKAAKDSAALTVEEKQRQRWKNLAESAETFCLRFIDRDMKQYIYDVCGAAWSESSEAFNRIVAQRRLEHEFSMNLLHRRDMADFPTAWNEFTDLYEARLIGIHDDCGSDDYTKYLAELKVTSSALNHAPARREEMSLTPLLGHLEAQIEYLIWDESTMAFTLKLSEVWTGMNGVRYKIPSSMAELAHILVRTLNRTNLNHLEVGEDLVKR